MPRKSDNMGLVPEGLSQIQRSNPVQDDFGWSVPVESIPLPTNGKIYPQNSPLHNKETVQIKAMTAQEEDILMSRALIKDGSVLTHLMSSCLIDKTISPRDMLNGDRLSVLVAIRITGYGPSYKVDCTCTSCGTSQSAEFDLSNLEIKRLEISPVAPGTNQFEYILPVSKKRVTFKFLTGRDEEERELIMERRRKSMPDMLVDNVITSKMEFSILSIDGISDKNKVNAFIRSMPAHDSRMFRKYISDNEPGIDMSDNLACVKCSAVTRVSLPIGSTFFWP
jgi:hypothetical protein